jgi:hypothetical protein
MKKILPFILFVIGILNHIPLFIEVGVLTDLYYSIIPRLVIQFLMLVILLYLSFKFKSKISMFFIALLLLFSILNNQLNKIESVLIIKLNENTIDAEKFINPFLGYKLYSNHNCKNCIGEATFIYNKGFGSYDALIYQPMHNINKTDIEIDASIVKTYNKDWWQYKHID